MRPDRAVPLAALAAVAMVFPLAGPAGADDAAWEIDREKSTFTVDVFKAGLFSSLAHDHTFDVTRWEAKLVFDPAAPEKGSIALTAQADSLRLRESKADADDQAEIEELTRGEKVLDAEKHPKITFASTRVRRTGGEDGRHELSVEGELVLHGEKKKLTIEATVSLAEGRLTAAGKVRLLQSDFGIEPYSAFLGAVAVKDEILISFELVAAPRS